MGYKIFDSNKEKEQGSLNSIPRNGRSWDENEKPDYRLDDGLGFVFAVELPANDYFLHQYRTKCGNGTFYIPEGFRVEFSVKPGTATYIGDIRYRHRFKKNMFGSMKPNGVALKFLNAEARDMELIRNRYLAVVDLILRTDILDWNGIAMKDFADRYYMEAIPNMTMRLVELVDEGERVQFHRHETGTNTAPGGTGAWVDMRGYEEWAFDEKGLIIQLLGLYDEEEYERQLNANKD